MKKTVLITGSSSGIGEAAALHFAAQGWNVAATMRNPQKDQRLHKVQGIQCFALDVTDQNSIDQAFEAVLKAFGRIDVVVNNAGYGVDGVFEAMADEVIQQQFDTNVFGLMRVTRAAIPIMRSQGGGHIVQIASVGGRITFPLFSIYHGTKWAVEGFSESLQYELRQFNIQVKIVEPGPIQTDFYGRSRIFVKPENSNLYDDIIAKAEKTTGSTVTKAAGPDKVAKTIYRAAQHRGLRMRFSVGQPGPLMLFLRKQLPQTWFFAMVRSVYKF